MSHNSIPEVILKLEIAAEQANAAFERLLPMWLRFAEMFGHATCGSRRQRRKAEYKWTIDERHVRRARGFR